MEIHSTDVLVVGSGAAGLRAAIAARERNTDVLLLSKGTTGLGTATMMSYGAFSSSGFGQSIEEHIRKTIETGHNRNNPHLVKILCEEASERIWELIHRGLRFKKNKHGIVAEGRFPILGKPIIQCLKEWASNVGVRTVNWLTVLSLLKNGNRVMGCIAVTTQGKPLVLKANAVILCTGGASALFRFHDNPITNIGDGYGLASKCGVVMEDMEFIQFYPLLIHTAHRPKILAPPLLAEKGTIVNDAGEDIVAKYELSSVKPIAIRGRDVLSISLYREMREGRKTYLDLRGLSSADKSLQMEMADKEIMKFLEKRYQSQSELLPVMPCAHFTMGGVVIDQDGRTSLKGLFAAGEVACGLHGANRMGGNALTETLVFGYRAGNAAASFSLECDPDMIKTLSIKRIERLFDNMKHSLNGKERPLCLLKRLQDIMWNQCGPIREQVGLSQAIQEIIKLEERGLVSTTSKEYVLGLTLLNSLETARIIVESAIKRKESIGAHQITQVTQ